MAYWRYAVVCLVCVCWLGAGCAESGPKVSQVSGKVELDGKPLDEGDITFVGDPGTVPEVLPIKGGAFVGKVKVGKKKVEIRAYTVEPPPPSATGGVTEVKTNYIPARFNSATTLDAEVSKNGVSPDTFNVESK